MVKRLKLGSQTDCLVSEVTMERWAYLPLSQSYMLFREISLCIPSCYLNFVTSCRSAVRLHSTPLEYSPKKCNALIWDYSIWKITLPTVKSWLSAMRGALKAAVLFGQTRSLCCISAFGSVCFTLSNYKPPRAFKVKSHGLKQLVYWVEFWHRVILPN